MSLRATWQADDATAQASVTATSATWDNATHDGRGPAWSYAAPAGSQPGANAMAVIIIPPAGQAKQLSGPLPTTSSPQGRRLICRHPCVRLRSGSRPAATGQRAASHPAAGDLGSLCGVQWEERPVGKAARRRQDMGKQRTLAAGNRGADGTGQKVDPRGRAEAAITRLVRGNPPGKVSLAGAYALGYAALGMAQMEGDQPPWYPELDTLFLGTVWPGELGTGMSSPTP